MLKTLLFDSMPACKHIEYFNGRLLGVTDFGVVYSEPLRYGLTNLAKNYLPYASPVTMVKAVVDGFYIAADKTYFVKFASGNATQIYEDSGSPVQEVVLPYGAVEGTGGDMPNGTDVYWFSKRGIVIAGNSGKVTNIMEAAVAVDEFASGASIYREQDGAKHIVSALSEQGQTSALRAFDYVSAEVIRAAR